MRLLRAFQPTLLLSLIASTAAAQQSRPSESDDALLARAKAIHERAITMDTHVDINPANFTASAANYVSGLPNTQVDVPKMEKGGLDAAFLIVYVGQRPELNPEGYAAAHAAAMAKFDAIHRLTKELAPDRTALALTADDVRRAHAAGKRAILIGVENAYPLGEDLSNIQKFYDRGGRYMSLAHNGHSQFSDSNTGERDGQWMHNGLSPLGRQAIAELNRVGFMIDISHPSKESIMQTLALSKAPVIASHSGVRALSNVSRNLDDEQLLALKKNGGVVQLVALSGYVKESPPPSPERQKAIADLRAEFGLPTGGPGGGGGGRGALAQLAEDKRAEFLKRMATIDSQLPPPPRATVKDFGDHIDYVVKLIGIDHVGISSDFDGGGGIEGWSNASETLNVTVELVRRGYTEDQIKKIWGGNLLRVMAEVQKVAKNLQKGGAKKAA